MISSSASFVVKSRRNFLICVSEIEQKEMFEPAENTGAPANEQNLGAELDVQFFLHEPLDRTHPTTHRSINSEKLVHSIFLSNFGQASDLKTQLNI